MQSRPPIQSYFVRTFSAGRFVTDGACLFLLAIALILFSAVRPKAQAQGQPSIVLTANTVIDCANTSYEGRDVIVKGVTLTIDCAHTFQSLSVIEGGRVTHTAGLTNGMFLTIGGDLEIDGQSRIDASARGFDNGQGPGAGKPAPAEARPGGGGYGGAGSRSE